VIELDRARFADFKTLLDKATQEGSDTFIVDGDTRIVLENVRETSLYADDFRFV